MQAFDRAERCGPLIERPVRKASEPRGSEDQQDFTGPSTVMLELVRTTLIESRQAPA
jgi:hypothetical protein